MKGLLCITILAAFLPASFGYNIDCAKNACTKEGLVHTLCKYPNPSPANACGKVFSTGFTQQEKQEMVNAHNELRSRVAQGLERKGRPGPQPPAKNMETIVWDEEIAQVAQRWTNQCDFGHDKCRNDERFYVGQNAAMMMTTGNVNSTPRDIANMWYNEVQDMDRNMVKEFTGNNLYKVGHYTQFVWATTNKIGCGKIVYQMDKWKRYYVVCNYGPGGNIIGMPIYQT